MEYKIKDICTWTMDSCPAAGKIIDISGTVTGVYFDQNKPEFSILGDYMTLGDNDGNYVFVRCLPKSLKKSVKSGDSFTCKALFICHCIWEGRRVPLLNYEEA